MDAVDAQIRQTCEENPKISTSKEATSRKAAPNDKTQPKALLGDKDSNNIVVMKNPLLQAGVALVANASIGVKIVSVSVLLSYCLSYSESAILALSVTPGYFWPPHFWLWTAFTHCFLEIHWWEVMVDISTIVLVRNRSDITIF